jgi:tetratricopeptide (TPR) repeat protein
LIDILIIINIKVKYLSNILLLVVVVGCVRTGENQQTQVIIGENTIHYLNEANGKRFSSEEAFKHYQVGERAVKRLDYKRAKIYFGYALAIDNKNPAIYNSLGLVESELSDFENGIKHLNAAIRLDSSFHIAHTNLASLYLAVGDYEKAIDECNIVLKLKTGELNYLGAHYNKAKAEFKLGKISEAYDDINAAITFCNDEQTWKMLNYVKRGLEKELDNKQQTKDLKELLR